MKKHLAIAGAITAVGLSAVAGVGVVSAQSNNTGGSPDSLVTKISQKFGLNKDEVQKVFDEEHQAHKADMLEHMKDRLTQAVKDGKLTQDQADKLLVKMNEMHSFMESLRDDSDPKTHKEKIEAKMAEFKQWAKDNNIPDEFMMMGPRVHIRGDADAGGNNVKFEGGMHTEVEAL